MKTRLVDEARRQRLSFHWVLARLLPLELDGVRFRPY